MDHEQRIQAALQLVEMLTGRFKQVDEFVNDHEDNVTELITDIYDILQQRSLGGT